MICFSYNNFSEQIDNISKQCNLRSYFADEDKLIDYFCYSVKEKRSIALTSGVVVKKSCVSENSIIFAHDISMGEDIDFGFILQLMLRLFIVISVLCIIEKIAKKTYLLKD